MNGISVDGDHLFSRLNELARIGAGRGGGVTRLVYTKEERAAVDLVAEWMQDAALAVRQDAVGNLFGRWPDRPGPAFWTGSHLDTVVDGGQFDGAAGVVAALVALEAVRETGIEPRYPLEVCVFVGEEGSRFPGGLLGSRAVVEGLHADDLEVRDPDGITLGEAIRAVGLHPEQAGEARRDHRDVRAYVELHIEQGPILEQAGVPIGAVTSIAGPLFLLGEIVGRADHAGTTPMDGRSDSLAAAAEFVLTVERIARRTAGTVATVGRLAAYPGLSNVIAGRTEFAVDIRHDALEARDRAEVKIREAFAEILRQRGLDGSMNDAIRIDPVRLPDWLVQKINEAAGHLGVPIMHLRSGAAHDAMLIAGMAPSGMIFVRSIGGRSHCPDESSSSADLAAGTSVLATTLALLQKVQESD